MTSPTAPLTLRELCALLGLPQRVSEQRRLRRYLVRRERQTGVEIFVRSEHRWWTTLTRVRDGAPELFSRKDEMAGLLRRELEDYEEALRLVNAKLNALAARVRQLETQYHDYRTTTL